MKLTLLTIWKVAGRHRALSHRDFHAFVTSWFTPGQRAYLPSYSAKWNPSWTCSKRFFIECQRVRAPRCSFKRVLFRNPVPTVACSRWQRYIRAALAQLNYYYRWNSARCKLQVTGANKFSSVTVINLNKVNRNKWILQVVVWLFYIA